MHVVETVAPSEFVTAIQRRTVEEKFMPFTGAGFHRVAINFGDVIIPVGVEHSRACCLGAVERLNGDGGVKGHVPVHDIAAHFVIP